MGNDECCYNRECVSFDNSFMGHCVEFNIRGRKWCCVFKGEETTSSSRSDETLGYDAGAAKKLEAVRSVMHKHRGAVAEPYLIPGGASEVLKEFFRDIERVLE